MNKQVIRRELRPNVVARAKMPCSEVCMHMGVAGQASHFRLKVDARDGTAMVQLCSDAGAIHAAPITTGEAGVFRFGDNASRFYYYPADPTVEELVGMVPDPVSASHLVLQECR